MGFFQSLKDDLSEAVDGILGEDDIEETDGSSSDASDDTEKVKEPDPFEGMGVSFDDLLKELEEMNASEEAADLPEISEDEDYVPATPEEIAAFEASDDDENSDEEALDMGDLDKLMANLVSMQEAEGADNGAVAGHEDNNLEEEGIAADGIEESENAAETAKTDEAKSKAEDLAVADNAEEVIAALESDAEDEAVTAETEAGEEEAAVETENVAVETVAETEAVAETAAVEMEAVSETVADETEIATEAAVAETETVTETAAVETEASAEEAAAEAEATAETAVAEKESVTGDAAEAQAGDILENVAAELKKGDDEPAASEEDKTALSDNGEQMTISQMMEMAGESSELIKQAEAMAEAAAIADIKEAEKAAKEAEEEATAEDVAAFEADIKPAKKSRKKASKTDGNTGADKGKPGVQAVSDETAVFAEGMTVKGNIESDGSLELCGSIEGNIDIAGKLRVTGIINGNTTAGELYADGAEINGDISCSGSVKVGQSTIIIGNITGSSAVIAGAVKGNIDVHGPVILDSVAIVMGDIRSQSLQISNGAAVEGMCSQVYSPITPADFFGSK